jgi:lysophospholipase L1-like esterase
MINDNGIVYLSISDSIGWIKISGTPAPATGSDYFNVKLRNYIRTTKYGACRLYNKGIGGSTSNDMVRNIQWIMGVEPDLVTILCGMNDCMGGSVPVATYTSNINKLIDRLYQQNPNVKIILCTPPRTTDTGRTPYIQSYRDALTTIGSSRNIAVCHFENSWDSSGDATNISSDTVHPTPTGQTNMYNTLVPVVNSVLGI